mmetsp:Transcript_16993/g.40545  ORF Transcript_16993/g.40545 Transcript_16993/m.40545 type:complete len:289 (-) Transcript_16993:18-884(-)
MSDNDVSDLSDLSDAEYSSQEEEEAALGLKKDNEREAIYSVEGLHDKLEEIAWTDEVGWEETQAVTTGKPEQIDEVEDDLQRELAFYNQALEAAKEAVANFQDSSINWRRPDDYYAEMVKSDEHMLRVKEQLNFETEKIEAAEQRRKQREAKRFQKQMQAERNKQKAQEKKRSMEEVTKWRKQRQKSGFQGDAEFDLDSFNRKPKKAGERISDGFATKSKKRQFKDSKFGFGGRKRLKKQNDAFSAADMSSYKPPVPDRKGKPQGKGGKKGGGNRPGKARRAAARSRR